MRECLLTDSDSTRIDDKGIQFSGRAIKSFCRMRLMEAWALPAVNGLALLSEKDAESAGKRASLQ
jgi:hypothetical protein